MQDSGSAARENSAPQRSDGDPSSLGLCAQSDGGDPTGFHVVLPGDPNYPTQEQLAQVKGVPVIGAGSRLSDEEIAALTRAGLILTGSPDAGPRTTGQNPSIYSDHIVAVDSQLTELLGRNQLVSELIRAGLEIALPLRDRGIDLIAYADMERGLDDFFACPIQMKASKGATLSLDRKYKKIHNLVSAYIWYIGNPSKTVTYALIPISFGRAVFAMPPTPGGELNLRHGRRRLVLHMLKPER